MIAVDKDKIIANIKTHRYPYLIILLVLLFNIPVLKDLVSDWLRDDNYSHGFFIIPISLYLFWRNRRELTFPAPASKLGILLCLFGCLGYIVGSAAIEYFTIRFSLVLIISGIALYYLGTKNFRQVWFAFFFLVFMIPIPAIIYYSATIPMQLLASKITAVLLHFIGVPVLRNGNIIQLPEYALEVAEACSGLRSLVTLLALGALYGYLRLPGKLLPVLLFLFTIPIAIATNIFRIFSTAVGAYAISRQVAEDFLHELSGILVFFTALFLMLIVGTIMTWLRNRFYSSSSS